MTITQYRNRLAMLTGDLKRARYDGNQAAIDRITDALNDLLDEYNRSKPCSD